MTTQEFNALPIESQQTLTLAGIVPDDAPVTVPVIEGESTFEADVANAAQPSIKTETQYEIQGDSVFMNITLIILGQRFKMQGVKLTKKENCMTAYDKTKKCFTESQPDVMSIIEMVRKYGAEKVNAATTAEVHLGKAGERSVALRDVFADAQTV